MMNTVIPMNDMLIFKVVTPVTEYCYEGCDSVRLSVSDGENGKGGGSCGIRKGHEKSILSLSEGKIYVSRNDEKILEAFTSSGFATVEDNTVTVIVDEFCEI